MDGDKDRTEGGEEEEDGKKLKRVGHREDANTKPTDRKEDPAAVKKTHSVKDQRLGPNRQPPPVPLRASAQKPKDLPLKEASTSTSGTRSKEYEEKSKGNKPAKASMKPGQPGDQAEAQVASKSPCRKRDTSPRFTVRKDPSPKRVTAEPKSPNPQRRCETREDGRGGRSPREDKAATPSPGGSPKRQQQSSGGKRPTTSSSDVRRPDEQLKMSPQKKPKSPADAKSTATASRASPGAKKKVYSPRQVEISPKRVAKVKTSTMRQKDIESSENQHEEKASRKADDREVDKTFGEVCSVNQSQDKVYQEEFSKPPEQKSSEQLHLKSSSSDTGPAEEWVFVEPTEDSNEKSNILLPVGCSGRQENMNAECDTDKIVDKYDSSQMAEACQSTKISSSEISTTCTIPETSADKNVEVEDSNPSNSTVDKSSFSNKDNITLKNSAIQSHLNGTQNKASVSTDSKGMSEDVSQDDSRSNELLTLERMKKDEKNSTIKALPETKSINTEEDVHKRVMTGSLKSEKHPFDKKKRVHSDSSLRNQREKLSAKLPEDLGERNNNNNNTPETSQKDKFQVDSLHEKLLQGESAIRKLAKSDSTRKDRSLSSPTQKTVKTRVKDEYQELLNKERKLDESLQRSDKLNTFPDNDAKCYNKLTNKHLKNVNAPDQKPMSVPKNKYVNPKSATCEPPINSFNGREQSKKLDSRGPSEISGSKETQSEEEATGCGGLQGRKCPVYFGVKSYLHQFYDSAPPNSPLYEGYIEEEDDFEYMVDPGKRRKSCCSHGLWFRAGIWGGANLLLIGMIAILVGHLTPQRQVVLETGYDLEVLDRTALAFNHRLELCRLIGLGVFCGGGMVLLITLLVSTIKHAQREPSIPIGPVVEPFDVYPSATKIPITEKIKPVQPTIWPQSATVREGSLVVQMP